MSARLLLSLPLDTPSPSVKFPLFSGKTLAVGGSLFIITALGLRKSTGSLPAAFFDSLSS